MMFLFSRLPISARSSNPFILFEWNFDFLRYRGYMTDDAKEEEHLNGTIVIPQSAKEIGMKPSWGLFGLLATSVRSR